MDSINNQNQYDIQVVQATPQHSEDFEKQEKDFEEGLKKCQEEMENRIKGIDTLKLSQIKEIAYQIINERSHLITQDKEATDKLNSIRQILVNNQVKKIISMIKDQWTKSLNDILGRIEFTFDLEEWINIAQVSDNLLESKDILKELEQQAKIKYQKTNFSEMKEFSMINSFMETMSFKLIACYTNFQFKSHELQPEYFEEYEQLKENLFELLLEKFKKKYSKIWKFIENNLKSYADSVEPLIKSKIEDDLKEENNISKLIKSKDNFLSKFKEEFQQFLQTSFEFTQEVNILFYKDSLEQLKQKIDKLYNEKIILLKKETVERYNRDFDGLMNQIKGSLIDEPFKALNADQKSSIILFLVHYIPVRDTKEKTLFSSILSFIFSHLPKQKQESQDINFIKQMIQGDYELYSSIKQQMFSQTKEGEGKLILFLLQCKNEDFYLIISQLYMIIQDIRVDYKNKVVEIKPYFGYLYHVRCELLKQLNKQLSKYYLTYFLNYLDLYFENKLIYQLGTYSQGQNIAKNSGYLIKFMDQHQDYELLHLLRTETNNQQVDHKKQIIQKFHAAINNFKQEEVKQPEPKIFHLEKVSHSAGKSRNIILVISGFTSQAEDKLIKWSQLADLYPNSEVYALEYESQTVDSIKNHIQSSALSFFIPGGKILKLAKFVMDQIIDNPFKSSFRQAEITGTYLAHFLHKGNLFPNCSVSLVGFSLGTQVIGSCLHEYKRLLQYNQPSVISSVMILGGVIDTNFIKRYHILDVVSHRVFNCYTNKDAILRYILRLTHLFSYPAGLQSIDYPKNNGQSRVVNLDFSHQINGHLPFMENLASILYQADFRSEFLTQFKETQEL